MNDVEAIRARQQEQFDAIRRAAPPLPALMPAQYQMLQKWVDYWHKLPDPLSSADEKTVGLAQIQAMRFLLSEWVPRDIAAIATP